MKIAIVSSFITSTEDPRYYSSQHLNLASELSNLGAKIDIFTMNRRNNRFYKEEVDINGSRINIYYFPPIAKMLSKLNIPMMSGIGERLKQKDYDIIQVSEDTQLTTAQVALQNKKSKMVIFQGINLYSRQIVKKTLMKIFDLSIGKRVKSRTDLVIAKTSQAERFMRSKGYRNIVTIPMGVDIKHFYPRDKKESRKFLSDHGVLEREVLALYVGNLIARRDIPTVLKAISIVKKSGIDIGLVIVGKGGKKKSLSIMVNDLGLREVVHFLDPIPNSDMPIVYSAADVFLFAPLYETFGMVILEAMACAIPIISTPIPAVKDILSENPNNGILDFPYSSSQELARQIMSFGLDRSLIQRKGDINLEIAKKYSWQAIARKFFEEYSKLV